MIASLLILGVLGTAAVLVVRRFATRDEPHPVDPHAVRRFFGYVLLYGLLVVSALGVSGLIGRLLSPDALATAGDAFLARSVAFTVVGVPLLAVAVLWSRRTLRDDGTEADSFGLVSYLTLTMLTSLLFAMVALDGLLLWAFGLSAFAGSDLADTLVWGAVWFWHWHLTRTVVRPSRRRTGQLMGALIGLVTGAAGLGSLTAGSIRVLVGLGRPVLVRGNADQLIQGGAGLLVGGAVWVLYWIGAEHRARRTPGWLGYVLLAGMGGGLATTLIATSTAGYDVLVWVFGHPGTTSAGEFFAGLPEALAAALVGGLAWWYHHAVLVAQPAGRRSEVERLRDYLLGGIGLGAAAAGMILLVVAVLEAVTGSRVVAGDPAVNTLIASVTLIVAGGPAWWGFWQHAQRAASADPDGEHASASRRTYLYLILGITTVAAVIALLVGTYLFVEDLIGPGLRAITVHRIRFPVAIVITAGAVAAYHWTVQLAERRSQPARPSGPRFILLLGPADPEFARTLARETGASVQAWTRADTAGTPWSLDGVRPLLADCVARDVVILSDTGGLTLVPVLRG